ncbi:unnamed protein product [Closterium sp. NIES-65]|nr:unnamed protein product [Closterium sp. NIES-65]
MRPDRSTIGRVLKESERWAYGASRVAGRKAVKDRLTVGFLVNADGSHTFRPLLFTLFIEQLNAAMYAEAARSGAYRDGEGAVPAALAARLTARWNAEGATSCVARFKPNLRDVVAWLNDAWMNIEVRTIQRCWWRTGCLSRAWAMDLPLVGDDAVNVGRDVDIGLDEEIGDVGILIDHLGLGSSAMPAAALVAIDDNQATCAEPGEDPLATEPPTAPSAEMWEAPATMQAVYEDSNPESREARRYARAASKMLIGYAKATSITPRDLCALFDIRNPIIRARMERASPPINLNMTPPPALREGDAPSARHLVAVAVCCRHG